MNEYTNRELGLLLESLTSDVKTGFKGVHARQDTTNGKVLKNCDDINDINGWRNKVIGAIIITNIVLVPVVVAVMLKTIFA